ncbi:hypothetical protein KQX54_004561 [Cotesia glomerata]|uniref:Uncharacterized protein n=1 Tax=Cotesia glomerata TaxID=32391 RepID=A0AAV7IJJ7_COTGL|nr:hypothetical protein KQX54_004561 [Cotesia glomerata]
MIGCFPKMLTELTEGKGLEPVRRNSIKSDHSNRMSMFEFKVLPGGVAYEGNDFDGENTSETFRDREENRNKGRNPLSSECGSPLPMKLYEPAHWWLHGPYSLYLVLFQSSRRETIIAQHLGLPRLY